MATTTNHHHHCEPPPSYDDVIAENLAQAAAAAASTHSNIASTSHHTTTTSSSSSSRHRHRRDVIQTIEVVRERVGGTLVLEDDDVTAEEDDSFIRFVNVETAGGAESFRSRTSRRREISRSYFPHYTEIRCSTKDDALRILVKYAKRNGRRNLNSKNCSIDSIRPSCVLKYTETKFWKEGHFSYKEERYSSNSTTSTTTIHRQRNNDDNDVTTIDVSRLKLDESVRIPNSEKIVSCSECKSRGTVTCEDCHGTGNIPCWRCQHSGLLFTSNQSEICYECSGSGKESCGNCYGRTKNECTKCRGNGKLIRYQKIKAVLKWKSQVDYEFDDKIFPEKILDESSGRKIPIKSKFAPLQTPPSFSVSHNKVFLKETKYLEILPVNEVLCTIDKEGPNRFWIIGRENNVFAPQIVTGNSRRRACTIM